MECKPTFKLVGFNSTVFETNTMKVISNNWIVLQLDIFVMNLFLQTYQNIIISEIFVMQVLKTVLHDEIPILFKKKI